MRRLVENQQAHKWDNFSTEFINGKVMGIVGYGEIGRECALLGETLGREDLCDAAESGAFGE